VSLDAATKSAEDTRDLAAGLAGLAQPGDVILLSGELGAGKTTFTQGFGRGLGVPESITSPTFTLLQTYVGRLNLVHVDVYRLDRLQEIVDLGLPEFLDDGAVALIEWGEAASPVLAADYLRIRIGFGGGDDDRTYAIEPVGASWVKRRTAVAAALERWMVA
jgi:tRNA threonylcarbamoyladenosine biosynthesis protein TsaE